MIGEKDPPSEDPTPLATKAVKSERAFNMPGDKCDECGADQPFPSGASIHLSSCSQSASSRRAAAGDAPALISDFQPFPRSLLDAAEKHVHDTYTPGEIEIVAVALGQLQNVYMRLVARGKRDDADQLMLAIQGLKRVFSGEPFGPRDLPAGPSSEQVAELVSATRELTRTMRELIELLKVWRIDATRTRPTKGSKG